MRQRFRRGPRFAGGLGALGFLVALALAPAPASAAPSSGTLEVCKAAANGMTARSFGFSVNGGAPVTIRGGSCSGPMQVASGQVTVRELESSPATDVSAVVARPGSRLVSSDPAGRGGVVTVVAGSTTATETRVTFTNEPAGGNAGELKICKLTETPSYFGRAFTFHVNGGPGFSTEANPAFDPPSSWSCRAAGSFQVGSVVTVNEDVPLGTEIGFIDADPAGRLAGFDTNAGTAAVTIGSGTTVVLYDDEPLPPTGTGFLEVCKDAALVDRYPDPDVTGPFDFRIDEPDGSTQSVTVLAGQCSQPLPVAAGVLRVTELARAGFSVVDVFTLPSGRLLGSDLVEVPASSNPADETQVHFVNARSRGQLKICKALGPGSAALIGRRFDFSVGGTPVHIVAAATTQCVIAGDFPLGAIVDVRETNPGAYVDVTQTNRAALIRSGANTLTLTNTARGKLEVCKFVDDPLEEPEASHVFTFRIDGGSPIKVRANMCSLPQLVTTGPHTVTESAEANYDVAGITVTPADAELSRNLAGRSVTVDVPWAGDPDFELGREVRIDFTNRIKRAQVKVCKHVEPGSTDVLGTKTFEFLVQSGTQAYAVAGLHAEECALARDPAGKVAGFAVIDAAGNPSSALVTETLQPTFEVSKISVQGARGTPFTQCFGPPPSCLPFVQWALGPNTNTAHFTNRATAAL